jgi:plastocyanin
MSRRSCELLALLAVICCGCATRPSEPTSPAAAVVTMTNFDYHPATVRVRAGETVEWQNKSVISAHTVTCDPAKARKAEHVAMPDGAEAFDSGKVKTKGTFRHTFTVPGRYRYLCIPHEEMGMVGEVEVVTP